MPGELKRSLPISPKKKRRNPELKSNYFVMTAHASLSFYALSVSSLCLGGACQAFVYPIRTVQYAGASPG